MPLKLLHEGEGHVVTVELKNGETYRGMLTEAEDSMNCQMKEGVVLHSCSSTVMTVFCILIYVEDLHFFLFIVLFCLTFFCASMISEISLNSLPYLYSYQYFAGQLQ